MVKHTNFNSAYFSHHSQNTPTLELPMLKYNGKEQQKNWDPKNKSVKQWSTVGIFQERFLSRIPLFFFPHIAEGRASSYKEPFSWPR